MGIGSALNIAAGGLSVTQDGLNVVAGNIANSETEGFTRRNQVQAEVSASGSVIGVRTVTIERTVNEELQTQLREFASVNVSNQVQADFLGRLDVAFGQPGTPTAIDTGFNNALASLETLAATPEDLSAQVQAVTDLQVFAGQLNSLSTQIQNLRQEADTAIAETVVQANDAIVGIQELNSRIVTERGVDSEPVALLDERDRLLDELSQILPINVNEAPNGTVQVTTSSGVSLVQSQAFQLTFDRAGTVTPETTLENGVLSSITVQSGGTFSVDLIANEQLQGGALGAYAQLRDVTLAQAQAQLDEFAAQLSLAISNQTVPSTVITDGLAVDTTNVQPGNTVSLEFTDSTGGQQSVTLVQVSEPSQLPLSDDLTGDPNDLVFGVDFASATAATDIQTFLDGLTPATGLTVAATATSVSFTGTAPSTVDGLSADVTATGLIGSLEFPLFVDSSTGGAFTNAISSGPGIEGYSQRIQVNQAIIDDPSLLARFTANDDNAGDSSRVDQLLERVRGDVRTFSPSTGIGASNNPVEATAADFLQIVVSRQGQQAASIEQQAEASQLSFNNIQERFQGEVAVNVDDEIARLIELEQAFQANARVLQTVQELIDVLLAI